MNSAGKSFNNSEIFRDFEFLEKRVSAAQIFKIQVPAAMDNNAKFLNNFTC